MSLRRRFLVVLASAVVCAAGGFVSALVSPHAGDLFIWPPAGLGLVAVLVWGRRAAAGIWAGTALALWLMFLPKQPLAAAGVGGIVAVWTLAVAWLVRRSLGNALALDRGGDAIRFLAIVGPGQALLAAPAVALLYAVGLVRAADVATIGLACAWAVAVGGVAFAPIGLALVGRPREAWRPRVRTVAWPMGLAAATLVAAHHYVIVSDTDIARQVLTQQAIQAADQATPGRPVTPVADGVRLQLLPEASPPDAPPGGLVVVRPVRIGGQSWHITAIANRKFVVAHRGHDANLVGPAGFAIVGLLAALLLTLTGETARATAEATARIGDLEQEVTTRELTEHALRSQGHHLAEARRIARIGSWECDPITLDVSLSPEAVELFGGADELPLAGLIALLDPADQAPFHGAVQAVAAGVIDRTELEVRVGGRWLLVGLAAETDDGLRVVEGTVLDITSRKQAELAVQASEQRLAEAQRIARIGSWEWNPATDKLWWSDEQFRVLGYEPRSFEPTGERFFAAVHPDDLVALRDRMRLATEGRVFDSPDIRVVHPDGTVRVIHSSAVLDRDAAGNVVRWRGTNQDVTEHRQQLKRLEVSHMAGRLLIAGLPLPDAVSEVLAAVCDLTGWEVAEFWTPDSTGRVLRRVGGWHRAAFVGFAEASGRFTFPPGVGLQGRVWATGTPLHIPDLTDAATFGRGNLAAEYGLTAGLAYPVNVGGKTVGVFNFLARAGTDPSPADRAMLDGLAEQINLTVERQLAEEKFRVLFEYSTHPHLLFDESDGIADCNPAALVCLRCAKEDILGRHPAVLSPEFQPDGRRSLEKCLEMDAAARRNGSHRFDWRHRRQDGNEFPCEVTLTPVTVGGRSLLLVTWHDLTDRVWAEEALRRSEARLVEAQRIAQIGYWEWTPATGETWWSDLTYQLLGYEPQSVPPTLDSFLLAVHPDDRSLIRERMAATARGEAYRLEFRVPLADGAERVIQSDAVIDRDAAGVPVQWRGTQQDITERKRAEVERGRMDERMRETQKLESLGVLAGGVAHDFNNLLTGILGNATLAREFLPADDRVHEFLRPIEQAATQAATLCQQMLAYAGKGRMVRQSVSLNTLLTDTAELLRLAVSKKVTMRFDLAPRLPSVMADAGQLRQVLLNLVSNASEAIGEKGGEIHVSTGMGDCPPPAAAGHGCRNLSAGPRVWVQVSDTGCGMPPEVVARIFEPFFTTKFTGRGLGLSAVYGIAQGHGGTVCVTSELGVGTTFRVYLGEPTEDPLTRTPPPMHTPLTIRNPPRQLAPATPPAGMVAVIADDEPMIRQIAAVTLRGLGFTIVEAENGRELVDIVRADPGRVGLVLLDLLMPVLDGREAVEELRPLIPGVPVVVMSGYSAEEITDQFAAGSVSAFMGKPFRPSDLTACVRAAVARQRRQQAAAGTDF